MRFIFKLLYIVITFAETVIIFRIVMSLIGANQANSFVNWIYSMSDVLISPFRGIVADEVYIDKLRIELTPIVSLIFYAIIALFYLNYQKHLKRQINPFMV